MQRRDKGILSCATIFFNPRSTDVASIRGVLG